MFFDILRDPDKLWLQTEDSWLAMDRGCEGRWVCSRVEVSIVVKRTDISIQIESAGEPVKAIRLIWEQHSMPKGVKILGDHWERAYGDLEWRGIVPERPLPWYFLANDGFATDGYGVMTGAYAFCFWNVSQNAITLTADVRCGNAGVVLAGRSLSVARVVVRQGNDGESAFSAARAFCADLCRNPLIPAKPVYGGNNWYYAYGDSSHKDIIDDSIFISDLADSLDDRPFMVVDDGWQLASGDGRCGGGPWTGNSLFPDMHDLAARMAEIGVQPGIWIRPLVTAEYVPKTWVRYDGPLGHVLDPSIPEVLDYIGSVVSRLVSWGYRLVKHDFSSYDIFGRWGFQMGTNVHGLPHAFADTSKTTAEIVLALYRTIAHAAGSGMVLGCNTVSHLSAGLFHIQRTGDDTSGVEWERTRRMGINTLAFRMPQHGTFYAHDADCVGITEKIDWERNRQWLELLATSGTPLFVSAKPGTLSFKQEVAVSRAFDLASKQLPLGEPLDWLDTTCPRRWRLNGEEKTFTWDETSSVGIGMWG